WWRSAPQLHKQKICAILLSAAVTGATTPVERGSVPGAADPAPGHLYTARMALHAETSSLSVATVELRAALDALGVSQRHAADLFHVTPRHVRRWLHGDRRIPHSTALVIHFLTMKAITIEQLEAAAKPRPPTLRLVEPAPEPSVPARAEAATLTA